MRSDMRAGLPAACCHRLPPAATVPLPRPRPSKTRMALLICAAVLLSLVRYGELGSSAGLRALLCVERRGSAPSWRPVADGDKALGMVAQGRPERRAPRSGTSSRMRLWVWSLLHRPHKPACGRSPALLGGCCGRRRGNAGGATQRLAAAFLSLHAHPTAAYSFDQRAPPVGDVQLQTPSGLPRTMACAGRFYRKLFVDSRCDSFRIASAARHVTVGRRRCRRTLAASRCRPDVAPACARTHAGPARRCFGRSRSGGSMRARPATSTRCSVTWEPPATCSGGSSQEGSLEGWRCDRLPALPGCPPPRPDGGVTLNSGLHSGLHLLQPADLGPSASAPPPSSPRLPRAGASGGRWRC